MEQSMSATEYKIREIALRIRELRLISGLSVEDMAERKDVTEQLKAEKPMEWVKRMNSIRSAASEMVNAELIFNQTRKEGDAISHLPLLLYAAVSHFVPLLIRDFRPYGRRL